MEIENLRLECLRLAQLGAPSASAEITVKIASVYASFVIDPSRPLSTENSAP